MRHIVRPSHAFATALICAVAVSGCTTDGATGGPSPTSTITPTEAPDVTPHESGPRSPIGYGLEVPVGAVQLGPLIRVRSPELIEAYRAELEAAQAERDARIQEELEEDLEPGETPPTPTPTPDDLPSDDSFSLLDEQPRPDRIVSVMRVDGDPTQVTRRMLAQLSALLPDQDVPTDDLTEICPTADERVIRCTFDATGLTAGDREVRVRLSVDPGNVKTRVAPPAAQQNPIMVLQVSYVGDPVEGQQGRESSDLDDVPDVDDVPVATELIWPAMDLDAPADSKIADGWVAPDTALILLSGFNPSFAALQLDSAAAADGEAERWVSERIDGDVRKDVVEDLNEVSTTYFGTNDGGAFFRATHVLSARGNYLVLMVYARNTPR